jgi:RNA polymerase sigma-70 factor (ECF subfamily)
MKGNTMTLTLTDGLLPKLSQDRTQCHARNKDGFTALLLPVKSHLYNFIRKAMNFAPEADDLYQDTLLKGYRYFHSFDPGKSFKTWIFTVAHNLLKDRFKAMGNQANVALSLSEIGDDAITAGNEKVMQEIREIYTVAGGLKPRHREVFFLFYYNEFTVAEIAAITSFSQANVKFILHQARKHIKKILEDQS